MKLSTLTMSILLTLSVACGCDDLDPEPDTTEAGDTIAFGEGCTGGHPCTEDDPCYCEAGTPDGCPPTMTCDATGLCVECDGELDCPCHDTGWCADGLACDSGFCSPL